MIAVPVKAIAELCKITLKQESYFPVCFVLK